MKIQHLAVIFVIIILPIVLVLSTYMENMIKVSNKERMYDSALYNATYDAVRSYQMNTLNNSFANVNTSRYRDVKATANSFFNSLKTGLSQSGYSKGDLNQYIPAILFTLYDGFYVYGPYENYAKVNNDGETTFLKSIEEQPNVEYGLKPYIHYSCEYSKEGKYDLIVDYTLDNYISVSGWYNGSEENRITKAGYYINADKVSNINDSAKTLTYNGVNIGPEVLEEYISFSDEVYVTQEDSTRSVSTRLTTPKKYRYINYKDEKYYFDESPNTDNRSYDKDEKNNIFYLSGYTRTYINKDLLKDLKEFVGVSNFNISNFKDVNAFYYYKNASAFSNDAYKALSNIDLSDNDNGQSIIKTKSYNEKYTITNDEFVKLTENSSDASHQKTDYLNKKIFNWKDVNNDPEADSSSFNDHRQDVIASTVEYSLTNSIANFNNYFSSDYSFRMPTLKETEWSLIANNVTVVSFFQGIAVGNFKYYNNYSIVANTKNKEFVSKNAIYVENRANLNTYETNETNYHDPRCKEFNDSLNKTSSEVVGLREIDYEIQLNEQLNYYFVDDKGPHEYANGKLVGGDDNTVVPDIVNYYMQPGTGGYECIISRNGSAFTSDDLLNGTKGVNANLRQAYILALAREKNASFKTFDAFNY